MITQREIVSQRVSEELIERSATFGILLDDISLVSNYSRFSNYAIFWQ